MKLPSSDVDPFSEELLERPYEFYRELRDAGPAIRLNVYDIVAISRYEDVRVALRDWRTFTSAEGVGFNESINQHGKDLFLPAMEPPDHDAIRAVMTSRLRLSEVRNVVALLDQAADAIVDSLCEQGTFDAIRDLAEPYVAGVVGELLGTPPSTLNGFVSASSAAFNSVGPMNERMMVSLPTFQKFFEVLRTLTKSDMRPGSIGWDIFDAEEQGTISEPLRIQLIWNFVAPAFDTTINALGNTIRLLAMHPDQWELLRAEPSLVLGAINEGMRCDSPIQIWGRFCREDTPVDGAVVPGGTRLAMVIGSANRDERHYPDADLFDIRRNPIDHLAFGQGIHLCVGAPLARQELTSVLSALVKKVRFIEIVGQPVRRFNNTTRGYDSLPIAVS